MSDELLWDLVDVALMLGLGIPFVLLVLVFEVGF